LTTETEVTIVKGEVGDAVVTAPIPSTQPAPPADDQKGTPPEGEAPPEDAPVETTEQQEAKKQSKFQRRLDRQKAARVAAETELRLTKERLAQLEAQPKQQQDGAEPKREQFENYEEYLRAVTKYDAERVTEQKLKTDREERSRREGSVKAAAEQEKVAKDWSERETAFQSATKDYSEVVTVYVEEDIKSLSDVARRAIVESELGPQVLYHLATNPEVAERIADLSPVRQVVELGKLEGTLTAPAPKKPSSAPAPITPTKPGRSAAHGYSENMTDSEYREWRKGNGARWAR